MENQLSTTALVIIAASGGVGALVAGLVAAMVNWLMETRRREHEKWVWRRDQKYETYSAFLGVATSLLSYGTLFRGKDAPVPDWAMETVRKIGAQKAGVELLLDPSNEPEFDRAVELVLGSFKKEEWQGINELASVLRKDLDET